MIHSLRKEQAVETIRSILRSKGGEVISVSPDAVVVEALTLMAERNIGAVLVKDAHGVIVGIFSERDFARKIIVKGRSCDTTRVKEIMTTNLVFANPDATLDTCMNLMTINRFRHLPIKEDESIIGIISIGDVVKALIEHQGKIIAQQAFEIGQNERRSPGAI